MHQDHITYTIKQLTKTIGTKAMPQQTRLCLLTLLCTKLAISRFWTMYDNIQKDAAASPENPAIYHAEGFLFIPQAERKLVIPGFQMALANDQPMMFGNPTQDINDLEYLYQYLNQINAILFNAVCNWIQNTAQEWLENVQTQWKHLTFTREEFIQNSEMIRRFMGALNQIPPSLQTEQMLTEVFDTGIWALEDATRSDDWNSMSIYNGIVRNELCHALIEIIQPHVSSAISMEKNSARWLVLTQDNARASLKCARNLVQYAPKCDPEYIQTYVMHYCAHATMLPVEFDKEMPSEMQADIIFYIGLNDNNCGIKAYRDIGTLLDHLTPNGRIVALLNRLELTSMDDDDIKARRWILDNDWLDTMITIPEPFFYCTKKDETRCLCIFTKHRCITGKVMLIHPPELYDETAAIHHMHFCEDNYMAWRKGNCIQDNHTAVVETSYLKTFNGGFSPKFVLSKLPPQNNTHTEEKVSIASDKIPEMPQSAVQSNDVSAFQIHTIEDANTHAAHLTDALNHYFKLRTGTKKAAQNIYLDITRLFQQTFIEQQIHAWPKGKLSDLGRIINPADDGWDHHSASLDQITPSICAGDIECCPANHTYFTLKHFKGLTWLNRTTGDDILPPNSLAFTLYGRISLTKCHTYLERDVYGLEPFDTFGFAYPEFLLQWLMETYDIQNIENHAFITRLLSIPIPIPDSDTCLTFQKAIESRLEQRDILLRTIYHEDLRLSHEQYAQD